MDCLTPFTLEITKYKEAHDGKKKAVFYIIDITKNQTQKWVVEKRYREFNELDKALKRTFGNLPALPGKTILNIKEENELEKRRAELEAYLQNLIKRTDIISSEPFKRFLQLENFAPEASVNPPKMVAEISGFVLGIRDFIYEQSQGILFTALSDMNVASRIDSYLTNLKMPWEKDLPSGTLVTVGAVECYIQKNKLEEGLKFEKLWFKNFPTQVICIYWCQATNNLLVGCDDGSLTVLKVSVEDQYAKYEESNNFKIHTARIMGVYLDPITEYAYTASEDRRLKCYEVKKNFICEDILVSNNQLTGLVGDKDNKRIFISDTAGEIYIFNTSPKCPILIYMFDAYEKGAIRGMHFDPIKNYMVTANYDNGILALIDMQKPGKEKFAHNVAKFHGKKKVRYVVWSTTRAELYSGDEDGNLTFWDAKSAGAVYALQAHNTGITKLQFLEKENIIISGAKDRKLKFYKLPAEWRDKKIEAELIKNARLVKEQAVMEKAKKLQQRNDSDSDDDLSGWARGL